MLQIYSLNEIPTFSFIFDYTSSTCSLNSYNTQVYSIKMQFPSNSLFQITYVGSILKCKIHRVKNLIYKLLNLHHTQKA